jgi:hypothetical protein
MDVGLPPDHPEESHPTTGGAEWLLCIDTL